jgi:hypothetical protein
MEHFARHRQYVDRYRCKEWQNNSTHTHTHSAASWEGKDRKRKTKRGTAPYSSRMPHAHEGDGSHEVYQKGKRSLGFKKTDRRKKKKHR